LEGYTIGKLRINGKRVLGFVLIDKEDNKRYILYIGSDTRIKPYNMRESIERRGEMNNEIRLIYPIGYELKTQELEDGQWGLYYVEKFRPEDSFAYEQTAEKLKYLLPPNATIASQSDRVIISLVAPRQTILNILAGEFLIVSSLGRMPLGDVLATIMLQFAEAKKNESH